MPTTRNVAGPDLLVSTLSGSRLLAIQVKTTLWAMRTRGRGQNKKPHHYEWDIGWGSAQVNESHLFYTLVDLQDFECTPDVFVVPSGVIAEYFKAGPANWPRARYHPSIEEIGAYKNNWALLREFLEEDD